MDQCPPCSKGRQISQCQIVHQLHDGSENARETSNSRYANRHQRQRDKFMERNGFLLPPEIVMPASAPAPAFRDACPQESSIVYNKILDPA